MENTQTFILNKRCERCNTLLPDEYGNLLCDVHYVALEEETATLDKQRKEQMDAELLKNPENPTHPSQVEPLEPALSGTSNDVSSRTEQVLEACKHETCGILDPNYQENPEQDDKDQVLANLAQFIYTHRDKEHQKGRKHGILLYYPQRNMYNFIKNYCMKKAMSHPQYPKYIWKPKIVDVGCGSGVGSNILSLEADMVWGIDKNSFSIEFAKEAFTREKNGIYYSSQLTFDEIDLMNDNRQFMAFDIVVSIEVAEHIADIHGYLTQLKRFTKRGKQGQVIKEQGTEFFISTPNRNSPKIRKDRPENVFHVREHTSQEFLALLKSHFENVEIMDDKGNPQPDDTQAQIIFAKCSCPK